MGRFGTPLAGRVWTLIFRAACGDEAPLSARAE